MVKRRSLDDALTPEEEAFLKLTPPAKPKTTKPKPKKRKEITTMSRPAVKEDFELEEAPASNSPAQNSPVGLGSINARIDSSITTALLRASIERRIERQTPATHREIIAEALSDWLKKKRPSLGNYPEFRLGFVVYLRCRHSAATLRHEGHNFF